MSVSYKKFFHQLVDKELTPTQVARDAGVSRNIIAKMRKDEYVSMESLEKICRSLDCNIEDILEFTEVE